MSLFFEELLPREWLHFFWRSKYLILSCAVGAAILGLIVASLLPKRYQTTLEARSGTVSSFVGFSQALSGSPGRWYSPDEISTHAMQVFVGIVSDVNDRQAYVLAHRALFPSRQLDDRKALQRIVNADFDVVPSKDPANLFAQLQFRYGDGTQGAEWLNGFAQWAIAKTKSTLYSDAKATLLAIKRSKQLELDRFRQQQDLSLKQELLAYQEALAGAKSAGLEKPGIVNSTTAIITDNLPLFLLGADYLAVQMKSIESHIGNDNAVPQFPALMSSISDIDKRLNYLDTALGEPIVITQSARAYPSIFPPRVPIVLISFIIGAILGALLGHILGGGVSARGKAENENAAIAA